ncbi:MAG: molybdate ABC transporter substrate-binding protein [Salibacteraceae bacterium]
MRKTSFLIFGILAFFSFTGCESNNPDLTIAVASNLQFVMEEIVADYEKETGQKVQVVTGSSGKLFAQIKSGAPFDVFLSADTLFPSRVIQEDLATTNYHVFAYGVLVLWSSDTLKQNPTQMLSKISESWKNTTKKWAIANPKTAPYGYATKRYLDALEVYQELLPYQVQGESVAQVNQFVHAKSVAFGFTSLSSVMAKKIDSSFWFLINPNQYPHIQQTALILNSSMKSNEFIKYLERPVAIKWLNAHGYIIPK